MLNIHIYYTVIIIIYMYHGFVVSTYKKDTFPTRQAAMSSSEGKKKQNKLQQQNKTTYSATRLGRTWIPRNHVFAEHIYMLNSSLIL